MKLSFAIRFTLQNINGFIVSWSQDKSQFLGNQLDNLPNLKTINYRFFDRFSSKTKMFLQP